MRSGRASTYASPNISRSYVSETPGNFAQTLHLGHARRAGGALLQGQRPVLDDDLVGRHGKLSVSLADRPAGNPLRSVRLARRPAGNHLRSIRIAREASEVLRRWSGRPRQARGRSAPARGPQLRPSIATSSTSPTTGTPSCAAGTTRSERSTRSSSTPCARRPARRSGPGGRGGDRGTGAARTPARLGSDHDLFPRSRVAETQRPSRPMQKAERLLNMAALLLRASEPVSWREIQEQFPDDYGGPGEAAIREFKQDKAELLKLRIPVRWVGGDEDLSRRLPGRQGGLLPSRSEAPARGPGAALRGRLGGAGPAGLPLRARPGARHEQALLRRSRAGRLGGGGGGGAAALLPTTPRRAPGPMRRAGWRRSQSRWRDGSGFTSSTPGRSVEAGPSATSIPTVSISEAGPGSWPGSACCARTSAASTSGASCPWR